MNPALRVPLKTDATQRRQLRQLQLAFAQVCNTLAPLVRQTRCWNRVALHHMAYKQLRERFPGMGSQMVCNAIYSVSRASRHVYQHPQSPFNVARLGERPLPMLRFLPRSPVYFDRHTLSIKAGQVSMYTLDGRIRFELGLAPQDEQHFRTHKLREIVLSSDDHDVFALTFHFAPAAAGDEAGAAAEAAAASPDLPEYLVVTDEPDPVPALATPSTQAALPT